MVASELAGPVSGTASITARGGAGLCGGGGGVVTVVAGSAKPDAILLDVDGGTASAGASFDGDAGTAIFVGP